MGGINLKTRFVFIGVIALSLGLWAINNSQALVDKDLAAEESVRIAEHQNNKLSNVPAEPGNLGEKPKSPEYAQGELIVKLKEGKTLEDISKLNSKYNVTSTEKVFKETSSPEDTLKQLKDKLAKLGTEHQSWYWQLDKNSQEYKNYMAKIEKEKEGLQTQIQAQEKLIAHLEERQKRSPEGLTPNTLENIYLLKTNSKETNIPLMMADYKANLSVEYAEPNYIAKAQVFPVTLPNDTYVDPDQNGTWSTGAWGQSYEDMWGLNKIQADKAWSISQGLGVIVAVVDTGIDYNHEDIAGNVWTNTREILPNNGIDDDNNGYIDDYYGYDFAYHDNDPKDGNGHGTHCAGIIAAVGNNLKGIIGVAYKAKVMAVKGLNDNGSGYYSDLANCIRYAADNGADVISNSWGGSGTSQTIEEALQYAYSKGCLITAAAGNDNSDVAAYHPANSKYVITVAATDQNDNKCYFSNYGSKIDVAAPGGNGSSNPYNILSLLSSTHSVNLNSYIVGSSYLRLGGTSMACPYVAGLAALVVGKYPTYSLDAIKKAIYIGAEDKGVQGWDTYYGFGRINVLKTLQAESQQYLLARIRSPRTNQQFGQLIAIEGTAIGSNFSRYIIEVGEGVNPATWTKSGITLNNDGNAEIIDGVLGKWDSSSFVDGTHTIRLKVFDLSGLSQEHKVSVTVNNSIKAGWPQDTLAGCSSYVDSPVMADIDNDKDLEVIAGTYEGLVYAWHHDGRLVNGWPVYVGQQAMTPAAADIDKDGFMEVVVGTNSSSQNEKLFVFRYDGTPYPGNWPKGWGAQYNYEINYISDAPALADLDNDGFLEIIVGGEDWKLHAWHYDGTVVFGWPVSIQNSQGISTPAVGDINLDGKPEIVAVESGSGSNGKIYAWNRDGAPVSGWPVNVEGSAYPPVIGDIDGDSQLEVVVNARAGLFAFKGNGTVIPGWPKVSSYKSLGDGVLALGDLDGDGVAEVILAAEGINASKVWVFKGNGSTFGNWPYQFNFYNPAWAYGAVVADVDGDAKQDVVVSAYDSYYSKEYLYIFEENGGLLTGYPKQMDIEYSSIPALGDADNNGSLEIAAFGRYKGVIPVPFYMYEFKQNVPQRRMDWPMFQCNSQHTGLYEMQDITPPAIPIVTDQGVYTTNTTTLSSTWSSSDPESGIIEYKYAIGTSKGGIDVLNWTSVGVTTSVTVSGLSLQNGKTYYFSVKAKNGAGFESDAGYSDGITVDSTKPSTPVVTDGGTYTSSTTQLTASWTSSDPESGITEYQYKITQGSTTGTIIRGWTSTGNANSVTATGLNLQNGKTYYFSVKAKNGAGLWSSLGYSNGITMDNPPLIGTITPSSGTSSVNQPVTFTTIYSDPDGWQNIQYVYLLINTSINGSKCFYGYYNQNTNRLYLRNDANTGWIGGYAPGSSYIIGNSYAKLDCSKTTVSGSGAGFTVKWNATFKSTFTGTKNSYLYVKDDANAYNDWIKKGSWTIK